MVIWFELAGFRVIGSSSNRGFELAGVRVNGVIQYGVLADFS